MGMTSVLIISNDHLHRIRDDNDFGRLVYSDVSSWPFMATESQLGSFGAVVSVGHASGEQIVSVQHGRGAPLPPDEVVALEKYRRSREASMTTLRPGMRVELSKAARESGLSVSRLNKTGRGRVKSVSKIIPSVVVLRDGMRNAERWHADFWQEVK